MSAPDRLDPDDPFGSQPDEKPPSGWDESLWAEVRARIEKPGPDPEPPLPSAPPPRPERPRDVPPRRDVPALMALIIPAAVLVASVALPPPAGPADQGPASHTVVQVVGTDEPDIEVEWARRGKRRTGYVVLESLDPQLSCIVIQPEVPAP
ncbi:MAG: hypothetical protein ACREAA_12800 [Candidatus Polarisedimenticolia bacterium]